MKTFLVPFLLAAAEAVSECAGPSPNRAAAVATPSPTEDLTLYRTSELLTSVELCDQEVKAALVHGDSATAQQWARRRGLLLDELRKRGVSSSQETTQKPVDHYRSHRVRHPSPTPTTLGLPGGRP